MRRANDGHIAVGDASGLFQALRPMGIEAIRVIFGHEMEREMRKLIESGALAKLPARRAKQQKKKKSSA